MKIPPSLRRASCVAVILIGLGRAVGISHAGTEISDQFSLKDRSVGLALNKLPVEKGDAVWEATKDLVLGGEGNAGYVAVTDSMPFAARVAVPGDAVVITAEAGLLVTPAHAEKPNFVAIGIGNPQLGTPTWGKGVYLIVQSDGHFICAYDSDPADFTSKSAVMLKAGVLLKCNPGEILQLELEYNVTKHTVSAWISGVPVLQNFELNADYVVEPKFAGFSGYGQSPKAVTARKFTVTATSYASTQ